MSATGLTDESCRRGPDYFLTTHWSLIARAREQDTMEGATALGELCSLYWRPLYVFARRLGKTPADAEDLTQSFFARLLEKQDLSCADPERGRFRTFLLTAFKHFLANEWDWAHRQKRGGFQRLISIECSSAEAGLGGAMADHGTPDYWFERQWALTLLERVRARLREEYAATGRGELWTALEGCVVRETTAPPYREIAATLGLTEAAVKMAVQRLRARYRALLREEIGKTVSTSRDIDDEIHHLLAIFST